MSDCIETERLVLRPFTVADAGAVVDGLGDIRVSRWLSKVPHPFTHEDLRLFEPDGRARWPEIMAITRDGDAILGCVGASPELGYWLAPQHWGWGIMTEAARAALAEFFLDPERTEIRSGVFEGNPTSQKVLRKLGFEETTRDEKYCRAQDRTFPHINCVLTRERWEAAV